MIKAYETSLLLKCILTRLYIKLLQQYDLLVTFHIYKNTTSKQRRNSKPFRLRNVTSKRRKSSTLLEGRNATSWRSFKLHLLGSDVSQTCRKTYSTGEIRTHEHAFPWHLLYNSATGSFWKSRLRCLMIELKVSAVFTHYYQIQLVPPVCCIPQLLHKWKGWFFRICIEPH